MDDMIDCAQKYGPRGLACGRCGRRLPLGRAFWWRRPEGDRDALLGLCPLCAARLLKEGEVVVRGKGRLYVLRRDPQGPVEVGGERFAVARVLEKPYERICRDPLGVLAELAGLEECPYHPGLFVRPDEPCPACLAEAQERALETLREEARDRR